ncbi:pantetheinase [Monodelphis domestica]|uniref:Pantetheinase n=1 Tax=Monodelphis domestica TaxID=13616 RepID=F6RTB1_MONDO|nr:pantetheinase [Monodelphis domestica]XP_007484641.1 pantetheinase [Monodelphis domestica]
MIPFQLQSYIAFFALWAFKTNCLDTFIAAVYEHAVILPPDNIKLDSREEALALMNENMDILEEAVISAAKQGAHIIVTPEHGIYGFIFNRVNLYPYLEDIPHPKVNWTPCTDDSRFGSTPVQKRLSCMARNNSIYMVANIGDRKSCDPTESKCPSNGYYQYNTNVVYDSEGKLVARYYKKYMLMNEAQFDTPTEPQLVTFDTTFGKFGILTGFDILFHDPVVPLVEKLKVDTILLPVAWMNTLPHLYPTAFHAAWAMGMRVNLLVANIHSISNQMTGSGIYAPDSVKAYYFDKKSDDGKLLVSELESHPIVRPPVNWTLYASSIKPFSSEQEEFKALVLFDMFTFKELINDTGNYTVCQNTLCCHLSYKMSEKRTDEVYVVGAFDGLHIAEGEYYLQICTLLKCLTTLIETCGQPVENASTWFDMFSLSGTFDSPHVFPELLLSGLQIAPTEFEILSDGRIINQNGTSAPVLMLTLFGRQYEKTKPPNASVDLETTSVMMITMFFVLYSTIW